MGMVGEACLPSNAYYPRTPDYTLYPGVHVCWSEHSDSSFVYGFMSLDYGLGTMTTTTLIKFSCFMYKERPAWANSLNPDQTPQSAASDQGLNCLPLI